MPTLPIYSSNFEIHALHSGGFTARYEIVDAAGDVIEAGEAGKGQATAVLAMSQARSRADAAIKALICRAAATRQ